MKFKMKLNYYILFLLFKIQRKIVKGYKKFD